MGTLRDLVDAGIGYAALARTKMLTARTHLKNAAAHIAAEEWVAARVDFDNAADSLGDAAGSAWYTNWHSESLVAQWRDALYWLDDNWPNGEVTMDAILNAMLLADFAQLTEWMGITDAYKIAVWNAPFNAEHYAALARGFRETW